MYPIPPKSCTAWLATHSPASTAVFLAKHTSVIRFGLARELPLDDVARVDAGDVDAARHLGERVLHGLPRDEWLAERLAVAAPLAR